MLVEPMENKTNTSQVQKGQSKDSEFISKIIINEVEKGTGLSYDQLKAQYNEIQLFYTALQYVTTTKRALCKAFNIEIPNNCRNKRKFEKAGILVQSKDKYRCPSSGHLANVLSTNPAEFDKLNQPRSVQLKMNFA